MDDVRNFQAKRNAAIGARQEAAKNYANQQMEYSRAMKAQQAAGINAAGFNTGNWYDRTAAYQAMEKGETIYTITRGGSRAWDSRITVNKAGDGGAFDKGYQKWKNQQDTLRQQQEVADYKRETASIKAEKEANEAARNKRLKDSYLTSGRNSGSALGENVIIKDYLGAS